MPEWWRHVKARKEHKCIICKKPIEAGATYTRFTELSSNGFVNLKMHEECEEKFDDCLIELNEKISEAEKESLAESFDFVNPDRFYKDENGDAQLGVKDGISPY